LLVFIQGAKKGQDDAAVGQKKLKKMEGLERESRNGIISMGAKEYNELIQKNPRPYDAVILWNVPSDFANCEHCTQV
jgi:hypothetical protein